MKFFLTKTAKHSLTQKKEKQYPGKNLKHNQFCKKSVTTNTNGYNMWTDPESHRLL
jgi:hypothetical protein